MEAKALKVLVPVDVGLASSLALRYLCNVGKRLSMEIDIVYVKEPVSEPPSTGSGWARRTWERESMTKAKKELSQFVGSEEGFCPALGTTNVVFGPRDDTILKEISRGKHDLLVEGLSPMDETISLFRRIRSKLYQNVPCPVLLVRKLMPLDRALILCKDMHALESGLTPFSPLFSMAQPKVDLLFMDPSDSEERARIRESLGKVGVPVDRGFELDQERDRLEDLLGIYGLVLGALERTRVYKRHPTLTVMDMVPSGLLLFLQS